MKKNESVPTPHPWAMAALILSEAEADAKDLETASLHTYTGYAK